MNISFCHSTSARSKSECKWNYTSFLKTPSETMQNFSWNMKERILNVNMLYFISAIVKIWHSQKTKGMGFCICFEKTSFLLLSKSFLKGNNVACMDSLSHHLESFLSQIQLLFFASLVVYCILIELVIWDGLTIWDLKVRWYQLPHLCDETYDHLKWINENFEYVTAFKNIFAFFKII